MVVASVTNSGVCLPSCSSAPTVGHGLHRLMQCMTFHTDLLQLKTAHKAYCFVTLQVTDVKHLDNKRDAGSLATASSEVAKLQYALTQHLNHQPDVIPAASLQQHLLGNADGVLQDLPDGSAHVLAQALQQETSGSTTSTSVNHQSSSRLGLQSSGSWTERLAAVHGFRQQSRSLDLSRTQPPQTPAAYLRKVSEPPATAVKGTSVHRLLSKELGNQLATLSGQICMSNGITAEAEQFLEHPYMRNNSNSTGAVLPSTPEEQQQRKQRLMEMCDNHAMFQFLFDADGKLLTANKRALNNMRGRSLVISAHQGINRVSLP